MKKVIIIGCPGSGKSTFARALRDQTNLPLFYLDMIWHKPDRTSVSREEFEERLRDILHQEQWIIDGDYLRTMEMRLEQCDTVFLLDFPLETCLSGAEARVGQEREDMPWVELEFEDEFKQWIRDFSRDQLPQIYLLLEKYRDGREIIIFRTREEMERYEV